MSVHHVYPRRFWKHFEEQLQIGPRFKRAMFWLCRKCHNILEVLIPSELVEDVGFYPRIARAFLQDPHVVPVYRENPKRFVQLVRSGRYGVVA